MDGNIIGYSDRGIYSATLTDEIKDALNKLNQGNNNNSSDDSGSADTPDNVITSGGKEKPPYFHPPYVI